MGFVQNRPDGRVLVVAEGDKEVVEEIASDIRIENSLINVETVDANYSNASGEFLSSGRSLARMRLASDWMKELRS